MSAIGAEPLLYKWKRNGEDITYPECTGINTPILTIHSFSQDHQGNYSCIVSNSQKSVSSGPANLALGMKYLLCFYSLNYIICVLLTLHQHLVVTQKVPSIEQTNTVPVLMPPGQLQPTTLTDHQSQCGKSLLHGSPVRQYFRNNIMVSLSTKNFVLNLLVALTTSIYILQNIN